MGFLSRFLPLYKDHEQLVFNAVKERLEPEAREILDKQLASVKKVHRPFGGSYVQLWGGKKGQIQFPCRDTSSILATVLLSDKQSGAQIVVEAWLGGGKLGSLEFFERVTKNMDLQVDDVTIHFDPMKADTRAELDEEQAREMLKAAFAGHVDNAEIFEMKAPLSQRMYDASLAAVADTTIPEDYLKLVGIADGFKINDSQVWGLGQMNSVTLHTREQFLVLAERPGRGAFMVRRRVPGVRICSYHFEDETVEEMGSEFIPALAEYMKGEPYQEE